MRGAAGWAAAAAVVGCTNGDGGVAPFGTRGDGDTCALDPGAGDTVKVQTCAAAPAEAPWDGVVEWTYGDGGETVSPPVVGRLTDDDMPDVAFASMTDGRLYVVAGDGGGLVCTSEGWDPDGGVAIADVDGDGANEVVGVNGRGTQVRAVDGACRDEWLGDTTYDLDFVVTTAADLDGDGTAEVIADAAVVDGRTGAHRATLVPDHAHCWRAPTVADLDLDGRQEILLGDTVFDADGTPRWDAPGTGTSCLAAVVDLDDDPEGEVVLAFGFELGAYDTDGAPLWTAPLDMPNPGGPCAGDLDGDGRMEVVAPHGLALTAYDRDGAERWAVPITDTSGSASCSVFDVDGDGAHEVLHGDEEALRIYDGRTGAVRFEWRRHRSITYFEAPTVADVDLDGAAELIVAGSSFPPDEVETGITVLGHAGAGWPAVGATWGLPDWSETNQLASGALPRDPVPAWLGAGVFRGRPAGAPDLAGEFTDACASTCVPNAGTVRLAVAVANRGAGPAAPSVAALVGPDGATLAAVDVPALRSGEVARGLVLELRVADWSDGAVLQVDDGGAVAECDEQDNVVPVPPSPCP